MMPLGLPALVMGLGILWTWAAVPLPVYGTMAILVIAFTGRFMPQGYRAISSSITQIHDDLENAAMVAGASRARAVRRITLPLMRGGIAASSFLMIVLGIRELTASLFLYTTNTRVLSIVLFEQYENGIWSSVASISLIYTALLVALTLVGRRWMRAEL
jgi:iron(III) transport system permease protein